MQPWGRAGAKAHTTSWPWGLGPAVSSVTSLCVWFLTTFCGLIQPELASPVPDLYPVPSGWNRGSHVASPTWIPFTPACIFCSSTLISQSPM